MLGCFDDLADEWLDCGWGLRKGDGVANHLFGFGEEGLVFAEEGEEGLALLDAVA